MENISYSIYCGTHDIKSIFLMNHIGLAVHLDIDKKISVAIETKLTNGALIPVNAILHPIMVF